MHTNNLSLTFYKISFFIVTFFGALDMFQQYFDHREIIDAIDANSDKLDRNFERSLLNSATIIQINKDLEALRLFQESVLPKGDGQ